MIRIQNIVSILLVMSILMACDSKQEKPLQNVKQDPGESLEKVNRYLVKTEKENIANYIRRHGWEMQETGSGLSYMIYEDGTGLMAEKGKVAVLKYKLWLITGDLVYSSDDRGLKTFLVGKGGVESGLEEAILLMKKGDKVRLVLPSHLAYGLLGDEDKIPPRTAIIYDIELVELN